jgi:hypothetical protein
MLGLGLGFRKIGVVVFELGIGIAMPDLAGERFVGSRAGSVRFDRALLDITVWMVL